MTFVFYTMVSRALAILFLLILVSKKSVCQFGQQLTMRNEEIIFAFQLKNQKWVSVCQDKKEKYIVYRFGTQQKIELQYPKVLDSTSWHQFTFNGYSRGGGKQNAAMYFGYLSFTNNGVNYEIYDTWNSEDDLKHCGVTVTSNGKTTGLKGMPKTKKGTLLNLLGNNKIKKPEE